MELLNHRKHDTKTESEKDSSESIKELVEDMTNEVLSWVRKGPKKKKMLAAVKLAQTFELNDVVSLM